METPQGIAITPVLGGQPISPDAYAALDPIIRARYEGGRASLGEDLESTTRSIRELQRSVRDQIRALDENVATVVVEQHVSETLQGWSDVADVAQHLAAMQADMIRNIGMFRGGDPEMAAAAGINPMALEEFFRRYGVNIIVDCEGWLHAPVVVEPNPTYANLIGSIERRGVLGTLVTDFTMIKSGALLRANGGFLLIELRDVLSAPFAWDGLKHALSQGEVKIEDPGFGISVIATASLEPQPIPLEINVVLVAEAPIAYTVAQVDPDFDRLFKIRAEFQDSVERKPEFIQDLAGYLLSVPCNGLPDLDASGVARVIEEAVRRAGDQRRLSVELEPLADIAREAMQLAGQRGRPTADAATVREALAARRERTRYLPERLQALIVEQTIMIDTSGAAAGQINGLEVMGAGGENGFGKPVRITARAFAGTTGVVNVDREVELGGPIHSKSVLILNGYIGGKYGRLHPLSLSASVVFEQTYQPVEGDSASLAELFTILSSLAGAPLLQSLAVTGSMNQHGLVQAIGGINEKVEGFFDVCAARGLTGEQGVVFPAANIANLMLREDVVQAIADGRFALYPITTVDEGIELFTGVPAGTPNETGDYSPDTIHGRVAERLAELERAAWAQEHGHLHDETAD
jgi:predicted ATP-dependent protease